MLSKEEAAQRIVDEVWHGTIPKHEVRAIVDGCLDGYAETVLYRMRGFIDVGTQQALETMLEEVGRSMPGKES